MRNTYDTPSVERIFAEQESRLPHGPLGIFRTPEVVVTPELREYMVLLAE